MQNWTTEPNALNNAEVEIIDEINANGGSFTFSIQDTTLHIAAQGLVNSGVITMTRNGLNMTVQFTPEAQSAFGEKTIKNDDSHVETQKAEWVVLGGVIQHKAKEEKSTDASTILQDADQGIIIPETNPNYALAMQLVAQGLLEVTFDEFQQGDVWHTGTFTITPAGREYLGSVKQVKQQKFLTLSALDKYLFRVLSIVYNAGGEASYPIGTSDEDLLGQLEQTGWVTIRFTGKDFVVTLTPEAQNLMDIANGPFASDVKSTTKDLWDQFANDMTPLDYAELANIQDGLIARLMPMDPVKHGPLCAKLIALGLAQGDVDNPSTLTLTSLGQQLLSDFNNPEFKGKKSAKWQKSGGKYYDLGVRYASNPAYEGWNVNGLISTAINNHEFNEFTLDNDPTYSRFNAATDEFAQGVRDEWDRRTLNEPEGTNPYKQTKDGVPSDVAVRWGNINWSDETSQFLMSLMDGPVTVPSGTYISDLGTLRMNNLVEQRSNGDGFTFTITPRGAQLARELASRLMAFGSKSGKQDKAVTADSLTPRQMGVLMALLGYPVTHIDPDTDEDTEIYLELVDLGLVSFTDSTRGNYIDWTITLTPAGLAMQQSLTAWKQAKALTAQEVDSLGYYQSNILWQIINEGYLMVNNANQHGPEFMAALEELIAKGYLVTRPGAFGTGYFMRNRVDADMLAEAGKSAKQAKSQKIILGGIIHTVKGDK